MRLRLRQTLRQQSRREMDEKYNPINLDYIFDEDDPLTPWLEERERPVFDSDDTSWLGLDDDDDGDGDGSGGIGSDPLAGTSVAVSTRLQDDDDDDDDDGDHGGDGDDDDDDDDTGSGGSPPGFGLGNAGGHDYFPTAGASTPLYTQYGARFAESGGATSDTGAGGSRDKGKNIAHDAEEYDVGQIGGDISSLYLHNHNCGYVQYPLPMPSEDSSINSSRYSMDYGHRYGEYGQSDSYSHQDMGSQLATSLFGGSYGHYQQSEQDEGHGYYQDPPRKSFWW